MIDRRKFTWMALLSVAGAFFTPRRRAIANVHSARRVEDGFPTATHFGVDMRHLVQVPPPKKPDVFQVEKDLQQIKKTLKVLCDALGVAVPPDVLC